MLRLVRVLFPFLISVLACAQPQGQAVSQPPLSENANENANKSGEPAASAAPTITFTLDFPASQPEHYSIRVPLEGPGHYQSTGRISRDSDDTDSFDFDFVLSAAVREKIFGLSANVKHFRTDLDSHQKNLAFTGKKTLNYKDARESGEASFNYSANPAARELTELFQSLSATLEFGHRLDYDHRYQKLALVEDLKQMQEMAQEKELIEVAAIQPILEQIVADPSVINVARARAQQLLQAPASR
jgi:hypothetical protein